jgi:ribosomal-protein-alanine N-acetyltransferase
VIHVEGGGKPMQFEFKPMNELYANEVVSWKYEGEYSVYDVDKNKTDIDDLLNSEEYHCFVAVDDYDEPLGFLECTFDEEVLEIANFLRPDLTGKGIGADFISACIDFSIEHFDYTGDSVKLIVQNFNRRAIKVYERIGFVVTQEDDDWVEMMLEL